MEKKMYYNIEELRRDLMDYYGTAMNSGFGMAVIDLSEIENASPEKLINIAKKLGVDLRNYIEDMER